MNEILTKAKNILWEQIGQDKIMVLATSNGNTVAARTVNVYTYNERFYLVTEADSNKYAQISRNNHVALSIDAIQITGDAALLAHPCGEENKQITNFVEAQLPEQFARYASMPVMRLIEVKPLQASFLLMETGEGYIIDFEKKTAMPIKHEM